MIITSSVIFSLINEYTTKVESAKRYFKSISDETTNLNDENRSEISKNKSKLESLDTSIKDLELQNSKIKRLLTGVSSDKISSGFFEESVKELWSSRLNKLSAIFWMLIISNQIIEYLDNPAKLAGQSAITIAGLLALATIPGIFLAKESSKRRLEHQRLRKTALSMHVLDAYIYDLKEDDKAEIKKKIAELIFASEQGYNQPESDNHFLLTEILNQLKKKE